MRFPWREIVKYCRERRECSEGEIAIALQLHPHYAYLAFRQLMQLCEAGILDTDTLRCIAVRENRKIVFLEKGEKGEPLPRTSIRIWK